ncbi:MAG: NAD-dependent epimerase/dehydratase family protein [Streptomyces sp.]|uniref:NAD-dependent epimerase/dehydratase family protein n=1 Tax=Streptomyces sp. TaxID=1931 RepID=UPI003D6C242F
MTPRVVLTGATGFIGAAVLRQLAQQPVRVRVISRRDHPLPPEVEWVPADLAQPESLARVCSQADVLIHAASHIGSDAEQCARVNDHGTAALMREAGRAGVGRIVQLSTTAVYGRGPHRGAAVGDLTPAPGSATSRTRLAAEAHALRHGAVVLRAGLVTGAGDRWVVPALAELVQRLPGYWNGGRAMLSMIAVEDLARLITQAALRIPVTVPGVHHAVHPAPVRLHDLLDALAALALLPAVSGELMWEECTARMTEHPGQVSERQLALLAFDHWYSGTAVWPAHACAPGPGPLARLADAAPWYRAHLAHT